MCVSFNIYPSVTLKRYRYLSLTAPNLYDSCWLLVVCNCSNKHLCQMATRQVQNLSKYVSLTRLNVFCYFYYYNNVRHQVRVTSSCNNYFFYILLLHNHYWFPLILLLLIITQYYFLIKFSWRQFAFLLQTLILRECSTHWVLWSLSFLIINFNSNSQLYSKIIKWKCVWYRVADISKKNPQVLILNRLY